MIRLDIVNFTDFLDPWHSFYTSGYPSVCRFVCLFIFLPLILDLSVVRKKTLDESSFVHGSPLGDVPTAIACLTA
ncbi:hypothetical protein BJX66DRAFT_333813 [Aspergillus keveii]|uniref:Uncharacterized protein n=1 Tax=Aspergillus keveii TaxID=714993 RepID=A0ABR4GIB1_9EURO